TKNYENDQDPLAEYFAARLELGPEHHVRKSHLRADYEQYCKAHGVKPVDSWQKELERHGFKGTTEVEVGKDNDRRTVAVWKGGRFKEWTAAQIAQRLGDTDHGPVLPTAGGSFTVAVRRATRVGDQAGLPLEDIGVIADSVHHLTRADLTDGNRQLLRAAAALLD
ncbi:MAG: hypothetical protein ACJ77H_01875, partial [Actinomycetota bacterium]